MAGHTLPYEVKKLVYDYLDLESIKSLRLVSKSWAAVGVELLLLPTFVVKSSSIDIPRLLKIVESPILAQQAAKTIKTLAFWSNDWDPSYLRAIICSRTVAELNFEMVDYVPDQVESDAFEELDLATKTKALDTIQDEDFISFIKALKHVPQVTSIRFVYPNPFKGKLPRKIWDEFSYEVVRHEVLIEGLNRFVNILSAAEEAGLIIEHLYHEQLPAEFFLLGERSFHEIPYDIIPYIGNLKTLVLNINNTYADTRIMFSPLDLDYQKFHRILSGTPLLEDLTIRFLTTNWVSLNFLPELLFKNLRSLMFSGVNIDPVQYIKFLERHSNTLVRLSLSDFDSSGTSDWAPLMEAVRSRFGPKLEKFQFCGRLNLPDSPMMVMLWPIYREDWSDYIMFTSRNSKTKDLEDYIIRGGPWPFTDEEKIIIVT